MKYKSVSNRTPRSCNAEGSIHHLPNKISKHSIELSITRLKKINLVNVPVYYQCRYF